MRPIDLFNRLSVPLKIATGYLIVWLVFLLDLRTTQLSPWILQAIVFGLALPLGIYLLREAVAADNRVRLWLTATIAAVLWWHLAMFVLDAIVWDAARANLARWGTFTLYCTGLMWVIWGVERASAHYFRVSGSQENNDGVWNPLDLRAWFYGVQWWPIDLPSTFRFLMRPADPSVWTHGPRSRKLDQSFLALMSYSLVFLILGTLFAQLNGCREIYEMPAGGGEQKQLAQVVKIKKVIRKKYVVNPMSAISFNVPPIDEVQLKLTELTKHAYTVGYGEGKGAGFAGGTFRGKVRFIRLEYSGGDWDQDFGIGGDLNMLLEYGIRTQHKVSDRTESRTVSQLGNFTLGKSPPIVYMTGQQNISLSGSETKILKEYLVEKHGMLMCDNGGSRHFHNQFLSLMNRILPEVRPVPIPLDDIIHRVPYQIPYLPYVVPHGGNEALGWYQDGRWLAYYHPGDIGDAWSDGHAGIKAEIWEACYQLGTNVIFYAHAEYSKWLEARKSED